MSMTPELKLRHMILCKAAEFAGIEAPSFEEEVIQAAYEALVEEGAHWDAESEVREGEVETVIPCDWSRHYESKSVAAKAFDGTWVGWTYWYGGGKHGEPEGVDWIEYAYALDCIEEEKLTVVRTFTKVEAS